MTGDEGTVGYLSTYRRWELWLARTGRWHTRRWTIADRIVSCVLDRERETEDTHG